jgi:hypothetical protein
MFYSEAIGRESIPHGRIAKLECTTSCCIRDGKRVRRVWRHTVSTALKQGKAIPGHPISHRWKLNEESGRGDYEPVARNSATHVRAQTSAAHQTERCRIFICLFFSLRRAPYRRTRAVLMAEMNKGHFHKEPVRKRRVSRERVSRLDVRTASSVRPCCHRFPNGI